MPIIEFEKPTKTSPYKVLVDQELTDLFAAVEGGNEKAAAQIEVPTTDVGRVKSLISETARAKGKTARYLLVKSDGKTQTNKETGEVEPTRDSQTQIIVGLGKLQKARRGPNAGTDAAPVETPAEAVKTK